MTIPTKKMIISQCAFIYESIEKAVRNGYLNVYSDELYPEVTAKLLNDGYTININHDCYVISWDNSVIGKALVSKNDSICVQYNVVKKSIQTQISNGYKYARTDNVINEVLQMLLSEGYKVDKTMSDIIIISWENATEGDALESKKNAYDVQCKKVFDYVDNVIKNKNDIICLQIPDSQTESNISDALNKEDISLGNILKIIFFEGVAVKLESIILKYARTFSNPIINMDLHKSRSYLEISWVVK